MVNITKFGAFVNILPGRDGLLHISKMGGGRRIAQVEDVLALGDDVQVVVREIDDRGKVSLDLADGVELELKPGAKPLEPGDSGGGYGDRGRDSGRDRGGRDRDRGRDRGSRDGGRGRERRTDDRTSGSRHSEEARTESRSAEPPHRRGHAPWCPSRTTSRPASRSVSRR